MKKCIAKRKLLFSKKGSDVRKELIIKIGEPYLLKEDEVNFEFHEGAAGCSLEFQGLEEIKDEAYGVDLLHALQLAVDVEPILKKQSEKYNFYFLSGEPYFDDE